MYLTLRPEFPHSLACISTDLWTESGTARLWRGMPVSGHRTLKPPLEHAELTVN